MILAALGLLAAQPAPTAPLQPVAATTAPESMATAQALARIVAPRDTLVDLNMKWGRKAILDLPKNDQEFKELESSYPGIHAAIWAAVEPEMLRQMKADVPRLWARLEKVYSTELTPSQIEGLARFYRTPTGQRMISGLYSNIDLSDATAAIVEDDQSLTDKALDEAGDRAKRKTVAELKPDPADLAVLTGVITMRHMLQLGELIQQATSDWYKEENPADQKKINDLMAAALERYMSEKDGTT